MNEDLDVELRDLFQRSNPVAAIHESMRRRMAEVQEAYHDGPTNHYVADMHLYRLAEHLGKEHPEQEAVERILALWRTVAKSYPAQ